MEYTIPQDLGRHGRTRFSSRGLDLRSRAAAQWVFFQTKRILWDRGNTTFCQNECSVESFPRDEVLDDPDASVDKILSM